MSTPLSRQSASSASASGVVADSHSSTVISTTSPGSGSVSSLPLPPSLLTALHSAGFTDTQDLQDITARELSRELGVSMDHALQILTSAKASSSSPSLSSLSSSSSSSAPVGQPQSSTSLALDSSMNSPIITFCRGIDSALGGGIPSGQVTELCGVPGIGKTQMAMQLALDVQIPAVFRGCGGEAVYIDTEGSCLPSRLATMAESVAKHLQQIAKSSASRQSQLSQMSQLTTLTQEQAADLQHKQSIADRKVSEAANVSVESLLNGVHMFRTHDQIELLAVIAQLSAFLESHPKVKLVVIDSIAFPFRQDQQGQDSAQRSRQLSSLSQELYRNALQKRVAVVVVNHVTTKVFRGNETAEPVGHVLGHNGSQIVPALGELWSHSVTNRIMMHWEERGDGIGGQERTAYLVKSPYRPCTRATFAILTVGVRDVPAGNRAKVARPGSGEESAGTPLTSDSQEYDRRTRPDDNSTDLHKRSRLG